MTARRSEGHRGDGHRKQVRDAEAAAEVGEKGGVGGEEGHQEDVDGLVRHVGHSGAAVGRSSVDQKARSQVVRR